MQRQQVYDKAPQFIQNAYQRTKRLAGRDVHVRLDAVAVRHVARYLYANERVAGRHVLDAASGSGYGSAVLYQADAYRGIDLDGSAVAEARRWFPGADFREGSVHDLPFDAGEFDAVVTFETLEHVPQPERAVSEFARVLGVGGVLVGSIPINHPDRIHHVRPYSAQEALDIFRSGGMRVAELAVQTSAFEFVPVEQAEVVGVNSGTLLAVLQR